MKIEGRLARWLVAIGHRLLQLWAATIRFTVEDRGDLQARLPNEQFIGALWHNRLLLFPSVLKRFFPGREGAALISASRDGALLADLVQRFGFEVVRGSTSRKGASAVRQLAEVIAAGHDVVITPDGPRGPAYEMGPGIVLLAQKSKTAVLPVNMEYSRSWRLKSWDRFIIPAPFSRVRVILGQPLSVAETATEEDFEGERVRLQSAMMELVETR